MLPDQLTCSSCGRNSRRLTRTLCSGCYARMRRAGTLDQLPLRRRNFVQWMSLVDTSDAEACWPWPGPVSDHGYGMTSEGWAHRVVYVRQHGSIASEMEVDHTCHGRDRSCPRGPSCKHRRCVNPGHLELVSHADNTRRAAARITRCPQGHEYTPENTVIDGGKRKCRTCRKERDRVRRPAGDPQQIARSRAYYEANRERINRVRRERRAKP